jgi:membrane protease subunit (stomatin/prohibitin family)
MGGGYRRSVAEMLAPMFPAAPAEGSAPSNTTQSQAAAPPAAAKFCTDCGTPVQPGAAYCTECGRKM